MSANSHTKLLHSKSLAKPDNHNNNHIIDEIEEISLKKKQADNHRDAGDYFFKFQFFIHECQLLRDFFNIARPAIALRFLDFPTIILEGI